MAAVATRREVMWTRWDEPGLEHLRLSVGADGVRADGLVIGLDGDGAFRAQYDLRCDAAWRVREARVRALDRDRPDLYLLSDGVGHWTNGDGAPRPELDGCVDVDLSISPFTNTLPIRRLPLSVGASAELLVTYLDLPAGRVAPMRQRYTRRAESLYRYESLPGGFTAELPVDEDGLVRDYPGLWRRAWSR